MNKPTSTLGGYDEMSLLTLRVIALETAFRDLAIRIAALEKLIARELWIFAGEIKDLKKKSLEKPRLVERIKKIIN